MGYNDIVGRVGKAMKKMLNTIIAILIFVLFPSLVLAEDVQVKEIKQIEKSEGVEISDSSIIISRYT